MSRHAGQNHATLPEIQALQRLRDATSFEDWHNKGGWDDESLLQSTQNSIGITIEYGHVTKLDLSYNGLCGICPVDGWDDLKWLEELILTGNELYGPLPKSIHKCHKLEWCNLSDNQFSGEIPPEFDDLQVCKVFKAANNELTGPIHDFWARLPAIFELTLQGNQIDTSDLEAKDFIVDLSSLSSIKDYINRRETEGGEDLDTWGLATFPVALVGLSFQIPPTGAGGPEVTNLPHIGKISVTSVEGLQGYFEKVQIEGVLTHVYSLAARVHWEAYFPEYDEEDLKHAHKRVSGTIVYPDIGSQCYPIFSTELEWNAPRPIGRQFEVLKHYLGTIGTGMQQVIVDAVGGWHRSFINHFPNNRALKICYQCPYREFFEDRKERVRRHQVSVKKLKPKHHK